MSAKRAVFGLTMPVVAAALLVACAQAAPAPPPTAAPAKPAVVSPTTPPAAKPAPTTALSGELAAGKTIFDTNCSGCHPGGGAGAGPSIKGKSKDDLSKKVRSGSGEMPAFGPNQISDQQLSTLVAYVSSLQ